MDSALPDDPAGDRSLRLPAHCTTVTAEDVRVRLVLAADLDGHIDIDASRVESIGQAVLQLLLAARVEAQHAAQSFAILQPSAAFLERVRACCLAEPLGLEPQEGGLH